MIRKNDIISYTYDGSDSMLGKNGAFNSDTPIPRVHPDFKASLRLKSGKLIDAPPKWRRMIWEWWITERRAELMDQGLLHVAHSMLGRKA